MREFLQEYYLWLEAFHIIAVISWMAGMLYLPRLFVYHTQVKIGSEASELFKIMERKLLRFIINPAMIVVFIIGGLLAWKTKSYLEGWFHAKFTLVMLMTVVHGMMARYRKAFLRDENVKSERFFRILNEIPAILMIGIVILVVVR